MVSLSIFYYCIMLELVPNCMSPMGISPTISGSHSFRRDLQLNPPDLLLMFLTLCCPLCQALRSLVRQHGQWLPLQPRDMGTHAPKGNASKLRLATPHLRRVRDGAPVSKCGPSGITPKCTTRGDTRRGNAGWGCHGGVTQGEGVQGSLAAPAGGGWGGITWEGGEGRWEGGRGAERGWQGGIFNGISTPWAQLWWRGGQAARGEFVRVKGSTELPPGVCRRRNAVSWGNGICSPCNAGVPWRSYLTRGWGGPGGNVRSGNGGSAAAIRGRRNGATLWGWYGGNAPTGNPAIWCNATGATPRGNAEWPANDTRGDAWVPHFSRWGLLATSTADTATAAAAASTTAVPSTTNPLWLIWPPSHHSVTRWVTSDSIRVTAATAVAVTAAAATAATGGSPGLWYARGLLLYQLQLIDKRAAGQTRPGDTSAARAQVSVTMGHYTKG